jgi:branched-chain amino acid transport system ATP-binding protein
VALLEIRGLTRTFGGVNAVADVSFDVNVGETVSIIGPNGAGKTTLFNLVTGLDAPTSGDVIFEGRSLRKSAAHDYAGLGIARTFQNGRVFGNLSVMDNVLIGAHARMNDRQHWLFELLRALWPISSARGRDHELRREAEEILALFGERLLPRREQPTFGLSYANRRRVELARALMAKPRLLLLDEPTAGMNPTETREILEFVRMLRGRGMTILLIEHKLSLVMELSDRVVVMDDGRKIAEGSPAAVRTDARVIEAYLGAKAHGRTASRNALSGSDAVVGAGAGI